MHAGKQTVEKLCKTVSRLPYIVIRPLRVIHFSALFKETTLKHSILISEDKEDI